MYLRHHAVPDTATCAAGIITMSFVKKYLTLVHDALFPPLCGACHAFLLSPAPLCTPCESQIIPMVSHTLEITASKAITVHAIGQYANPLRGLVLAKSSGVITASRQLGELMWLHTPLKDLPADYVIPMPLHWQRYLSRGFNQAHEMAIVIAHHKNIPVVDLLVRHKNTVPQLTLPKDARQLNVTDAFALNATDATLYKDAHLLLIDDLCTTGATARAAAKILFQLKPASITLIVACRVQ